MTEQEFSDICNRCVYVIKGETFEVWQQWHTDIHWEEVPMGRHIEVGTLNKRPVCIDVFFAKINGQYVAFIDDTSELVDWKMIDQWIEKQFPEVPTTNKDNFHQVTNKIYENFPHLPVVYDDIWKLINKAKVAGQWTVYYLLMQIEVELNK